jgi:hypothetical protein
MRARVVHVSDNIPGAVYIGRAMPRRRLKASPFANPYKVAELGRDRALLHYEWDLRERLVRDETVVRQLLELKDKPLACWCRHDGQLPTPSTECHGDVLIRLIGELEMAS